MEDQALAPSKRERQAFTRISKLSTLEEIYKALEEDALLRNVKIIYIILLYERKEALQLRDTDVVKTWWSREKAWTLGERRRLVGGSGRPSHRFRY